MPPYADVQPTTHRTDPAKGLTRDMECPYCGQAISRKEFHEIRARIETEERARIAEVEGAITVRFARERAVVEAQAKAAVEKARREAAKGTEAKVKALRQNQETVIAARLAAQQEAFTRRIAEAVNAEKLSHHAEKLKLEEQLQDMQRRLQAKTAHQIGEPAEVDLFDALVAAFPHDRFSRTRKGARGPDVIMEVIQQGEAIGIIVFDSKAHARWSNKFIAQTRSDQLAAGAAFGVVVSTVFPAGARELHLQDNVVVVSPARAVTLVQLLRRQINETHRLRITGRARDEKAAALLAFVTSAEADYLFGQLHKAADGMVELEVKEVDTHQGVWRKRGELIRLMQRAHDDLTAAIDRIINTGTETVPAEVLA